MVNTTPATQEALLGWFQKLKDRGHDGPSNRGRENPIITVSDTDGASVRNKPSSLFRDKKEEALIKIGRGALTRTNRFENSKENRSGQIRGRTPSSKRNTIRARGRIIGMVDREDDVIKGNVTTKRGVDFFVRTTKETNTSKRRRGNWPGSPYFRPKISSKRSPICVGNHLWAVKVRTKVTNTRTRGRGFTGKDFNRINRGGFGEGGRNGILNIVNGRKKTNVAPAIILKRDKRGERGANIKKMKNRREVLTGGIHMTEKRNKLGKEQGSRARS